MYIFIIIFIAFVGAAVVWPRRIPIF